jgi:hypothetical protein
MTAGGKMTNKKGSDDAGQPRPLTRSLGVPAGVAAEGRMTLKELKAAIADLPNEMEIVVRVQWEDDEPDGNCFALHCVTVELEPDTAQEFAAFDCDQVFDDEE